MAAAPCARLALLASLQVAWDSSSMSLGGTLSEILCSFYIDSLSAYDCVDTLSFLGMPKKERRNQPGTEKSSSPRTLPSAITMTRRDRESPGGVDSSQLSLLLLDNLQRRQTARRARRRICSRL